MQEAPLVRMTDIGRSFGTVVALEGVNFDVGYQEVIALLGDNGAGKSTLIKVLTGVHPPTTGQIYFEGHPVSIASPQDARQLGIETVYQDLALVPLMSIARNFYLGREPVRSIGPIDVLDQETMVAQTTEALAHIGIKIRGADEPVGTLSGGERQSIAIGRAVHFGTKLLILDEPTSALSIGETRKVLNYTLEAKRRGLSVIFITHNIHHVFQVADRFTIISHGHKVGDFRKQDITIEEVSGMIMGEPVPERLRAIPPPEVIMRPIVVSGSGADNGSNGQGNGAAVGAVTAVSAAAAADAKTMRSMIARRRRFNRRMWGAFAVFLAVVFGLTYYHSRPKVESDELVPPLVKTVHGTYFTVPYPDGWIVARSEANIIQLRNDSRNWEITFQWDSAVRRGVSPSKPLAQIAAQIDLDDFTGRELKPGAEFQAGAQPAYRREWTNAKTGRGGVEYIFFDHLSNFYIVTHQSNIDQMERLVPLSDAIMGKLALK
jgi:simple sugar transport system ATP-binding protein